MKFMKLYKSLLAAVALTVASVSLTGCDEDLAVPPLAIPHSDMKANTTIADFKAKYWSSETNYYTEVGLTDEGEHIILGGRIAASDDTGNIYQNLILQDETGAVTIAIYMKNLNTRFKVGEEMFIDVTGLYAGKYAGMFEIGKDDIYAATNTPQIGKMDEAVFLAHAEINGLPKPSEVYTETVTIADMKSWASDPAKLQKYQSQLIRINGVSWKGGGETLWADAGTSHNTRYLYDESGQSIAVDNSGYSDFCDQVLPAGHGDIIAVASYYNGNWQLVFRGPDDCIDFGGETYAPETPASAGDGSADSPFTVGSVINGAAGTGVWVTGYIVGWIDGMTMADGAKFSTPASSVSNILLAANPDEKAVANCIPVALPSGSTVRTALNLQDNPTNLGKQVSIFGNLTKYFGANGIKECSTYTWGDKGGEEPELPGGDTPVTPSGDATFTLATSITSGSQYVLVVDGQVGAAISSTLSYGRLTMEAVTISGGSFTTSTTNALTITAVAGGYTITDAYGRYLGMDTSHLTSFQLYTANQDGCVWTISVDANGLATITNVLNPTCQIVRSGTYTNIAPSDISAYPTFDAPYIYVKSN